MSARRELAVALGAPALGGAVAVLAAGRRWGSATFVTGGRTVEHVAVTGHDVVGALSALGIALLALAGALLAARGRLRRLVGIATAGSGLLIAWLALTSAAGLRRALLASAFGVAHPQVAAGLSGWAVASAAGGVVAAAGGVLTAWRGPGWTSLGTRYDAPAARPAAEAAGNAWDALDRGEDPTAPGAAKE